MTHQIVPSPTAQTVPLRFVNKLTERQLTPCLQRSFERGQVRPQAALLAEYEITGRAIVMVTRYRHLGQRQPGRVQMLLIEDRQLGSIGHIGGRGRQGRNHPMRVVHQAVVLIVELGQPILAPGQLRLGVRGAEVSAIDRKLRARGLFTLGFLARGGGG